MPLCGLLLAFAALPSCVKPKVYRLEKERRKQSEAREVVQLRELADRKKEAANLTKTIGELNRTIGAQEEEIRDLKAEVIVRSQQFGESEGKLAAQKAKIESQFFRLKDTLALREATLQRVVSVQKQQAAILLDIFNTLSEAYYAWAATGATVDFTNDALLLTLPDRQLFAANGLTISPNGFNLLMPLAEYLAAHPELNVEIEAHTDNTLPKDKSVKDTWDWSLARAANVARALVRDLNVNANQLTPVGKGEFDPVTSNETAEGRAQNRRTVIVFKPDLPPLPAAE